MIHVHAVHSFVLCPPPSTHTHAHTLNPVPCAAASLFVMQSHNRLEALPDNVWRAFALQTMHVSHNHLLAVPEGITRLPRLTALTLAHNELQVGAAAHAVCMHTAAARYA